MNLVQVFLPLADNKGQRFSRRQFEQVEEEFQSRFGGFTAYVQAPARGLWEDRHGQPAQDDLVLYEVMTEQLDRAWWSQFRRQLEDRFRQEEIVARVLSIDLL